jgi:hypothetical protein
MFRASCINSEMNPVCFLDEHEKIKGAQGGESPVMVDFAPVLLQISAV